MTLLLIVLVLSVLCGGVLLFSCVISGRSGISHESQIRNQQALARLGAKFRS